jgi:hypothetical protein
MKAEGIGLLSAFSPLRGDKATLISVSRPRNRRDFVRWVGVHDGIIKDISPFDIVAASGCDERRYAPDGGLVAEDWPDLKACCGPENDELTQWNRNDITAAILKNALLKAGCSVGIVSSVVEHLTDELQGSELWAAVEQSSFAGVAANLSKRAAALTKSKATTGTNGLVIDRSRFKVSYKGRSCFLGNSKPFQLLERFSKARDTYLNVSVLMHDVWLNNPIQGETVQRHVSILRKKLKKAGIEDIVIDGSQPDHYCLILR